MKQKEASIYRSEHFHSAGSVHFLTGENINPRNTTQRCSACGSIVKKDLSVRVHECPYCGFSCDRDYNASRNILITGMEQPVAPIESKPLHHISVMQVLAMKWEAAPFRTR